LIQGATLYAAVIGAVLSCQAVLAVTLDVGVGSPLPPITESDFIELVAFTSEEVLPDTAWVTETTSLVVDGFDVDWTLHSYRKYDIGLQVIIHAGDTQILDPLPMGTYNVTATWVGEAPIWSQHLLPLVGTTQFTVVPEPGTLLVLSGGLCLWVSRRRR